MTVDQGHNRECSRNLASRQHQQSNFERLSNEDVAAKKQAESQLRSLEKEKKTLDQKLLKIATSEKELIAKSEDLSHKVEPFESEVAHAKGEQADFDLAHPTSVVEHEGQIEGPEDTMQSKSTETRSAQNDQDAEVRHARPNPTPTKRSGGKEQRAYRVAFSG